MGTPHRLRRSCEVVGRRGDIGLLGDRRRMRVWLGRWGLGSRWRQ